MRRTSRKMLGNVVVIGLLTIAGLTAADTEPRKRSPRDPYGHARAAMIDEIRADVRATSRHIGLDELDQRVMTTMGEVPRHLFVPASRQHAAYENRPLPIGYGQTISQPYIVALMTHLAAVEPGDLVLEIGTGSGYQAAVLSRLAGRVLSVEIVEPLERRVRSLFRELGYDNISVRLGDGYDGWPGEGPFDAIVVTAAASHVPPPLVRQLANGGRMVIPVGSRFAVQDLLLIEKDADGEIRTRQILPVRFVPLTRSE